MPADDAPARRRERSNRYPGVPLEDAVELARFIEERSLDGLPAAAIAEALGFSNIKSNAFSARVSAARQFGLLTLEVDGYALTDLAREILHPVEPKALGSLHRKALLEPPLYAELAARFGGKRLPEPAILANVLYHHHNITASAKDAAAEAFLESAKFAGALDADGLFRPEGAPEPAAPASPPKPSEPARPRLERREPRADRGPEPVRIDLPLWDKDAGKRIRLRAPGTISRASFERFLQAFRLHIRIEDDGPTGEDSRDG